jgi:hypothetical protein
MDKDDCWVLSIVFHPEPNWRMLAPCALIVVFHFSCPDDCKKP